MADEPHDREPHGGEGAGEGTGVSGDVRAAAAPAPPPPLTPTRRSPLRRAKLTRVYPCRPFCRAPCLVLPLVSPFVSPLVSRNLPRPRCPCRPSWTSPRSCWWSTRRRTTPCPPAPLRTPSRSQARWQVRAAPEPAARPPGRRAASLHERTDVGGHVARGAALTRHLRARGSSSGSQPHNPHAAAAIQALCVTALSL
jgi:hypothetical protein